MSQVSALERDDFSSNRHSALPYFAKRKKARRGFRPGFRQNFQIALSHTSRVTSQPRRSRADHAQQAARDLLKDEVGGFALYRAHAIAFMESSNPLSWIN
jgi:hypothetical protein